MRLYVVLVLILLLITLHVSFAWRFFNRGRGIGGNLGSPHSDKVEANLDNSHVIIKWFIQKLDHFEPADIRTWNQRYYVNDEFYDATKGGPIFLMIGGEGEATIKWMIEGTWINYAKKFGALCFQLEHRFYGKSHPTKHAKSNQCNFQILTQLVFYLFNSDLSIKNLQYLTSQQALADLAYFVSLMNAEYKLTSDSKWIAFGGSYPGSLAAWLRNKYPHLVHGAMSASGPLLAEIDFFDYFRVVDEALATYSDECLAAVKEGTQQVDLLMLHMIGQRTLNEQFQLCDPIEKSITNANDVSNFFESIAGNFAGVVQYNKDNRQGSNNITIDTLCDIMTNQTAGPPVTRLAHVNSLILNSTNQTCLDYKYDKMIANLRNVSWDSESSEGARQWTYQTCTEFGFFQSSTYETHVFGRAFPAEFFIQQCVDILGPKFGASFLKDAVERTNIFYGALNIEVSNVVFVQGSIDPWHALGITKTANQNAPAIYIEGTAHCANMYPERNSDLPALKAARVQIENLIDSWIRL